jgi:hypothetical protein
VDINASVVGWDDHEVFTQRIRNYTAKEIEVEVRRSYSGHIEFKADLGEQKLFDYQTVQYTVKVGANKKADLYHEVVTHQGRNRKQGNVTLLKVDAKP